MRARVLARAQRDHACPSAQRLGGPLFVVFPKRPDPPPTPLPPYYWALLQILVQAIPTDTEKEKLLAYKGDVEQLGEVDQYFLEMIPIPRLEQRIKVINRPPPKP